MANSLSVFAASFLSFFLSSCCFIDLLLATFLFSWRADFRTLRLVLINRLLLATRPARTLSFSLLVRLRSS